MVKKFKVGGTQSYFFYCKNVENVLPEAIHVLGFTEKGRQHLKSLKGQVSLVSRIGKEPWDAMTQKADQIYQLGKPSIAEQNFGRVPIRIETN
ncbi:putative nucleotidyltransferase [Streptococcus pneumoniae]|nr:putative nucleotidyltransferase [Streptococcus pneumoniae]